MAETKKEYGDEKLEENALQVVCQEAYHCKRGSNGEELGAVFY